MAGHALVAVFPLRLDLDEDAGQFRLKGLYPGHLFPGQVGADSHLMQAGFLAILQLGCELLGIQAQQAGQAAGQQWDVRHILQDHCQFKAGPVGHQHLALVVQNHAPPGRQVLEADAVVFRALLHFIPLQQLQEPEAQEEDSKEAENEQGDAGEGPADALLFFRRHHPPKAGSLEPEAGKS